MLCSYLTQANLLSPLLRHRSINLFLLAYQRIWIETEEYSFEEKLVQDLAVSTRVIPQCPLVSTRVLWGAGASLLQNHFPLLVSLFKVLESASIPQRAAGSHSVIHTTYFFNWMLIFSKHDITADVRAS